MPVYSPGVQLTLVVEHWTLKKNNFVQWDLLNEENSRNLLVHRYMHDFQHLNALKGYRSFEALETEMAGCMDDIVQGYQIMMSLNIWML